MLETPSLSAHQLNKEITELESLVESKIYREDELERELDSLRQAQRRAAKTVRKVSKGSSELDAVPEDRPATSPPPPTKDAGHARTTSLLGGDSDVCEICERPGHDIFSCDLLRESSSPTLMMSRITSADSPAPAQGAKAAPPPPPAPAKEAKYCVDCDSDGHVAEECPYALDVF
jgi:CAP-Gly domain-containing linker protein 1